MFRPEAIAAQRERLHGTVLIVAPVSWQIFGYLLFVMSAVVLSFLSMASYARVETVTGTVVPDKGLITVQPSRAGTILALSASEGRWVSANEQLAVIRAEEDSLTADTTGDKVSVALNQQRLNLDARDLALKAAARAQSGGLAAERAGVGAELEQLESQAVLQHKLIASAESELIRLKPVAERGFISGNYLREREETILARRQQLAQIRQTLISKQARIRELDRSIAGASAQAEAQSADLASSRSQLEQAAASAAGARSYAIRAPIAGRITSVIARQGQQTDSSKTLFTIIPDGARLRAELSVTTAAIGFVRSGQTVRLAIDAFPYQRFGVVSGKVLDVSRSPVPKTDRTGIVQSAYIVGVALDRDFLVAFGRREPLLPGMTLSARIIAENRSLAEWLFEPLMAVGRR